jgi:hypothetical protein
MGHGGWSTDAYVAGTASRAATGTSAFHYTDHVAAVTPRHAMVVHDKLNPLGVKVRESRDSAEHPESLPVVVVFDVTGSMGRIPRVLQEKLPMLMQMLLRKGVAHPQIMFMAVGDATCDRVPLQVGQFESDNKMEGDLSNMYLEGGGGGQDTESYELAAYFLARHTATDANEKRGRKGYAIFIGDERYYPKVSASQVKNIIGDDVQDNIPTPDIFKELGEKFETYFLIPKTGASHSGDDRIRKPWVELLGQNVLVLDDPAAVSETLSLMIAIAEGNIDLEEGLDDLKKAGVDDKTVNTVSKALVTVSGGLAKASAVANLPDLAASDSGTFKL